MVNRVFQLLLVACLATSPLRAETDPFVGQWKLTKLADQMKVTEVGANTYAFDFGGGVETIAADGTDHPGNAGTTLSVEADGTKWKVIRKKGGHTLITATWTLSKDGNVLKDDFTSFSQDGSPSTVTYVYERRAPGLAFAGTWVSTTLAASSAALVLRVRPYESNGISFITPSAGQTLSVNFDGKYHATAQAGFTLLGRRLSPRDVEIIRKTKGEITQTRQIELSPNLKILTMTVHLAGKDAPNIYVFERQ
jgi:hypothetical protein